MTDTKSPDKDFIAMLVAISPQLAEIAEGRINAGYSVESVRQDIVNAITARVIEENDPTVVAVSAKHVFTPNDIANMLCGEFEFNPMASWLGRRLPVAPEGVLRADRDNPWYVDEGFIGNPAFAFTVEYDEEDDEEGQFSGMKTITRSDIRSGLSAMAASYPEHFADLIHPDGNRADAVTYDVAMQCIVLGSVIYG